MPDRENTTGSPSTVTEITTVVDFEHHTSHLPSSTLLVLYFHTPWAAPCAQMATVLSALASSYPVTTPPAITFLSLDAEELPDISESYDVSAVPFLVLVRAGNVIQTVSGSDAAKVRDAVEKHAGKSGNTGAAGLPPLQAASAPKEEPTSNGATGENKPKDLSGYAPDSGDPATAPDMSDPTKTSKEELHQRLSELVKAAPVMLFMKGTPSAPQCGFSRQTVSLLRDNGVRYGFFNILADDEVRQGLKEFADWPTFPQVWIDGELVGGLDILKEEVGNNPEFLKKYAVKPKEGSSAPDAKGGPTAPEAQIAAE